MTAEPPSRNDGVTTCGACGAAFIPVGRQRWCSPACRAAAHRRRHHPPTSQAPLPPPASRRALTVYQCGSCEARALGQQRCEDCNTWMRAVGIGGLCPCCDEPIAVAELTQGGDR